MATKFVRGLYYRKTTGVETAFLLRLMYEFWGYCINGTSSLSVPGAVPTPNGTAGPTNLFENTPNVTLPLMLAGSDGVTVAGTTTFSTATGGMTAGMVGKYLVVWKPASGSSEDSIYRILTVAGDGLSCTVDVNTGGTPDPVTLKPSLTTRISINFRVVDPDAASKLVIAGGNYFIGTLDPTGINAGQANSQFQILIRVNSPFYTYGIVGAPSGGWTGSAFAAPVMSEVQPGSTFFYNTNQNVNGYITLIGDKDFLVMTARSDNLGAQSNSMLHIEIPKRVFTLAQDPNPLALMITGQIGISNINSGSYVDQFRMLGYDNATRQLTCVARTLIGCSYLGQSGMISNNVFPGEGLVLPQFQYNATSAKALLAEVGLSQMASGQYELLRCMLRRVRFCGAISRYHLLGDSAEWFHIGGGTCWPWDGTFLPYNLFQYG